MQRPPANLNTHPLLGKKIRFTDSLAVPVHPEQSNPTEPGFVLYKQLAGGQFGNLALCKYSCSDPQKLNADILKYCTIDEATNTAWIILKTQESGLEHEAQIGDMLESNKPYADIATTHSVTCDNKMMMVCKPVIFGFENGKPILFNLESFKKSVFENSTTVNILLDPALSLQLHQGFHRGLYHMRTGDPRIIHRDAAIRNGVVGLEKKNKDNETTSIPVSVIDQGFAVNLQDKPWILASETHCPLDITAHLRTQYHIATIADDLYADRKSLLNLMNLREHIYWLTSPNDAGNMGIILKLVGPKGNAAAMHHFLENMMIGTSALGSFNTLKQKSPRNPIEEIRFKALKRFDYERYNTLSVEQITGNLNANNQAEYDEVKTFGRLQELRLKRLSTELNDSEKNEIPGLLNALLTMEAQALEKEKSELTSLISTPLTPELENQKNTRIQQIDYELGFVERKRCFLACFGDYIVGMEAVDIRLSDTLQDSNVASELDNALLKASHRKHFLIMLREAVDNVPANPNDKNLKEYLLAVARLRELVKGDEKIEQDFHFLFNHVDALANKTFDEYTRENKKRFINDVTRYTSDTLNRIGFPTITDQNKQAIYNSKSHIKSVFMQFYGEAMQIYGRPNITAEQQNHVYRTMNRLATLQVPDTFKNSPEYQKCMELAASFQAPTNAQVFASMGAPAQPPAANPSASLELNVAQSTDYTENPRQTSTQTQEADTRYGYMPGQRGSQQNVQPQNVYSDSLHPSDVDKQNIFRLLVQYHVQNKDETILAELLTYIRVKDWQRWIGADSPLYKVCLLLRENQDSQGIVTDEFKNSPVFLTLFTRSGDAANFLINNDDQIVQNEMNATFKRKLMANINIFLNDASDANALKLIAEAKHLLSLPLSADAKKGDHFKLCQILAEHAVYLDLLRNTRDEYKSSIAPRIAEILRYEASLANAVLNYQFPMQMLDIISLKNRVKTAKFFPSSSDINFDNFVANRILPKIMIDAIKANKSNQERYLINLDIATKSHANNFFENLFLDIRDKFSDNQNPTADNIRDFKNDLANILELPVSADFKENSPYYIAACIIKDHDQALDALMRAPRNMPLSEEFLLISLCNQIKLYSQQSSDESIIKNKIQTSPIFAIFDSNKSLASKRFKESTVFKLLAETWDTTNISRLSDAIQLELDRLFIEKIDETLKMVPAEKSGIGQLFSRKVDHGDYLNEFVAAMKTLLTMPISDEMKQSEIYRHIQDNYRDNRDPLIELGSETALKDQVKSTMEKLRSTRVTLFNLHFDLAIADFKANSLSDESDIDKKEVALILLRSQLRFIASIPISEELQKEDRSKNTIKLLKILEAARNVDRNEIINNKFNEANGVIRDITISEQTHLTRDSFSRLYYMHLQTYLHAPVKNPAALITFLQSINQLLKQPLTNDMTNTPIYKVCQLLTSHLSTGTQDALNLYTNQHEKLLHPLIQALPAKPDEHPDYAEFMLHFTNLELAIRENSLITTLEEDQSFIINLNNAFLLPTRERGTNLFTDTAFFKSLGKLVQSPLGAQQWGNLYSQLVHDTQIANDDLFIHKMSHLLDQLEASAIKPTSAGLFAQRQPATNISQLIQSIDSVMMMAVSDSVKNNFRKLCEPLHQALLELKRNHDQTPTKWDEAKFKSIKKSLEGKHGIIAKFEAQLHEQFFMLVKTAIAEYQNTLLERVDSMETNRGLQSINPKLNLINQLKLAMTLPLDDPFKKIPDGIFKLTKYLIGHQETEFDIALSNLSALVDIPDTLADHCKELQLNLIKLSRNIKNNDPLMNKISDAIDKFINVIRQFYQLNLTDNPLLKEHIHALNNEIITPPDELTNKKKAAIAQQLMVLGTALLSEYRNQPDPNEKSIAQQFAARLADTFDVLVQHSTLLSTYAQRLSMAFSLASPPISNVQNIISNLTDTALAAFTAPARIALLTSLQNALSKDLNHQENLTTLAENIIQFNAATITPGIESRNLAKQLCLTISALPHVNLTPELQKQYILQLIELSTLQNKDQLKSFMSTLDISIWQHNNFIEQIKMISHNLLESPLNEINLSLHFLKLSETLRSVAGDNAMDLIRELNKTVVNLTRDKNMGSEARLRQLQETLALLNDDAIPHRALLMSDIGNIVSAHLNENDRFNLATKHTLDALTQSPANPVHIANTLCDLAFITAAEFPNDASAKTFASNLSKAVADMIHDKQIFPDAKHQLLHLRRMIQSIPREDGINKIANLLEALSQRETMPETIANVAKKLCETLKPPLDADTVKHEAAALSAVLLQERVNTLKYALDTLPIYPGAALYEAREALIKFAQEPFPGSDAMRNAIIRLKDNISTFNSADAQQITMIQQDVLQLKSHLPTNMANSLDIVIDRAKDAIELSKKLKPMCETVNDLPTENNNRHDRDIALHHLTYSHIINSTEDPNKTGALKLLSMSDAKKHYFELEEAMRTTHPSDIKPETEEQKTAAANYQTAMRALRDVIHVTELHMTTMPGDYFEKELNEINTKLLKFKEGELYHLAQEIEAIQPTIQRFEEIVTTLERHKNRLASNIKEVPDKLSKQLNKALEIDKQLVEPLISLIDKTKTFGAEKMAVYTSQFKQVPNTEQDRINAKTEIITALSSENQPAPIPPANSSAFKAESNPVLRMETKAEATHAIVAGSAFKSGENKIIKTDEIHENTETKRLEILTNFTTTSADNSPKAISEALDQETQSVRTSRFGDKVDIPSTTLIDEFAKTLATALDQSESLRILRELDLTQNMNICESSNPARAYALCLHLANFKVRWNTVFALTDKEIKAFDFWVKKQIKNKTVSPGLMALLPHTKYKDDLLEITASAGHRRRGQTV